MELGKVIERRVSDREPLSQLPGPILISESNEELECKAMDISPAGLGVYCYDEIETGTRLFLVLDHSRRIELEVKWSLENPGDLYGFRHGLIAVDPTVDLYSICTG